MKSKLLLQIGIIYIGLFLVVVGLPHLVNIINAEKYSDVPVNPVAYKENIKDSKYTLKKEQITIDPIKIYIPKLNKEIKIEKGGFDGSEWILSDDKAFFDQNTQKPNNSNGNTLIYGHNTDVIFYPTKDLIIGDVVRLEGKDGRIFEYTMYGEQIVAPTDLSIFSYSGPPQLTILTCNGWYSENRKLLYFNFSQII